MVKLLNFQCAITIDACLHADACRGSGHGDVVEPNVLHIFCIATNGSAMACSEVAVPDMDILCVVITNHIVVTRTDVAVVDVCVVSPDGDAVGVMRWLFCLGF